MAPADLSVKTSGSGANPPSPPGHWLLGHLGDLQRDPIAMLVRARAAYGDIVGFRLWTIKAYLLSHPDHIHHVLQRSHTVYDKDLMPFKRLSTILGQGMLTADGSAWQHQRDVAKPAFHQRQIETFVPIIAATVADVAQRWTVFADERRVIDMHQEMMHLTLRLAGRALFGVDLDAEAQAASDLLNVMLAAGQDRVRSVLPAPMFVPTRINRCLKTSRRDLERMIDRIIEQWQAGDREGGDMLRRLLDDHDAISPANRTQQFYDEAITLILAGHETTANALCFSLHLLSHHRDSMGRLREEARSVIGGRSATAADVPKLVYTRMVLDEAMRLFPPAWVIDRNVTKTDEIGGYVIPKGSLLFLSPYVMHRHPAFWPDPERFDPLRFEKGRSAERPRHVYFPFSIGPRVCIGASFALTEAVLALAILMERFEVVPIEGHVLTLDPGVTLRPKNGLPMAIRKAGS